MSHYLKGFLGNIGMTMEWPRLRRSSVALAMVSVMAYGGLAMLQETDVVDGSALAQQTPTLPEPSQIRGTAPDPFENPAGRLDPLGPDSDADIWRQVRRGIQGGVPIPNPRAGVLIQSEGEEWRNIRNGPMSRYGWWALAGMTALLALFFAYRGRIAIDDGVSGQMIERFNGLERFAHWLTGGSFVVLALTGLNTLYGRYLFAMDAAGDAGDFGAVHSAFATATYYGKFVHNYVGFAFAAGVVLMFVVWVPHNFPRAHDFVWLAKAGGLFVKGSHPPAGKFNAGQKILFWLVVIGGLVSFGTGLTLMFPFVWFGMQDMQLMQLIHSGVALALIAVIIAHIYIGSLGMQGAFDAMGTGQVDENWARQHHSLWVAEVRGESHPGGGHGGAEQPAE